MATLCTHHGRWFPAEPRKFQALAQLHLKNVGENSRLANGTLHNNVQAINAGVIDLHDLKRSTDVVMAAYGAEGRSGRLTAVSTRGYQTGIERRDA
jgi:hypothetical protein